MAPRGQLMALPELDRANASATLTIDKITAPAFLTYLVRDPGHA